MEKGFASDTPTFAGTAASPEPWANPPKRRLDRLALAALVFLAASPLHATDYTVTSLADSKPTLGGAGAGASGDLRYCITQANFGAGGTTHTITFAVTGKITLAAHELVVNSDLTITGPGARNLIIDGANATRILYVMPGHTVAISGLALTRGNGIGNDATGLDPRGNYYDGCGGAILNGGGTVTIDASTVTACETGAGGAIFNKAWTADASLTVSNSTISGNTATDSNLSGGGIHNWAFGHTATLTLTGSAIRGNTAPGSGGGIYNHGQTAPAIVTITDGEISGNSVSSSNISGGAGIYSSAITGSTMTITGSVISGNVITGNPSAGGAGILQLRGVMTLTECAVRGNSSATFGGGISNYPSGGNATMNLRRCTISGNSAGTSGAGIFNSGSQAAATLDVSGSTIAGNVAKQRGGGLYNLGTGTTINGDASTAVIGNTTIAGNSALGGGGGIANDQPQAGGVASVTLRNTLLALHPTGANYGSINGTAVSGGFNLFDDLTGAAFLIATGDQGAVTAGLQIDANGKPLLQVNGGPTETIALLPASAALDAGKSANDPATSLPATTDQRGLARPFDLPDITDTPSGDGSDIGAFESDGSPLIIPAPTPPPDEVVAISVTAKPKITTSKARQRIRGTATGGIKQVTYRVGSAGKFKRATGTNRWTFVALLEPGRNVITVIFAGIDGTRVTRKIVVIRKD